jgi:hypothetical protein
MTRSLAGTFWIFSITGVLLSGVGAIFYLKDGHLKNADKYFNELEKETRD